MLTTIRVTLTVFLVVVVPLLTFGYDLFEGTALYSWLFSLYGVESAVSEKLTTQFGDPKRLVIDRNRDKKEFMDLWELIRTYSNAKIPDDIPQIISRVAIENGTYVTIPRHGKVVLIPNSVPVLAFYCSWMEVQRGDCRGDDAILVGTIGDIKEWTQLKRKNLRLIFNLIITIISVSFGFLVQFLFPKERKKVLIQTFNSDW